MGTFKLWYLCTLPAVVNIFENAVTDKYEFDLVLIFVSLVCSFVGSSVQLVHKNLETKIELKEILAVYVTGLMVALAGYFLGEYTKKLFITALATVFASYMSLDLFASGKKASLYFVSKLPDTLLEALRQRLNSKYEERNNTEENDDI